MGNISNEKKSNQLGMPFDTASGRLRKMVIFYLLEKHNENFCFQCGEKILKVVDLSIEHKKPWLDESIDLFWDINNIAFSHINCNVGARRFTRELSKHGTKSKYDHGCRCDDCKNARKLYDKKRYENGYKNPNLFKTIKKNENLSSEKELVLKM